MTMKHALGLAVCLVIATSVASAGPYQVGSTPKETNWESWGYQVDYQDWANWFAVSIEWGTDAAMSGSYVIEEDFLFRVDPETSGLTDPSSVYGQDFWNHDDVYGLGEFFDAGLGTNDRQYAIDLDLTLSTWSVWYDADRDLLRDGGSEHDIFGGTVSSYWDRGGYFYGILTSDNGKYDGFFTTSHDEGNPDLINSVFHAGAGDPIPEPGTMALLGTGILGLGALSWYRRRSQR